LQVEVSNEIQPAHILYTPHSNYYGLNVRIAAWGDSEHSVTSPYLKTVELIVLSKADCEERIFMVGGTRVPIHERRLCTAANPFALTNNVSSVLVALHYNIYTITQK
jgi:hypothetical protein